MIERNLGNAERILRLLLGTLFGAWVLAQPDVNGMEIFITLVAVSLMLNGVFSRCYLWYILDVNTAKRPLAASNPSC